MTQAATMTQAALARFRLLSDVKPFRARVVAFCDARVRPRAETVEATADYPSDLHWLFARRVCCGPSCRTSAAVSTWAILAVPC